MSLGGDMYSGRHLLALEESLAPEVTAVWGGLVAAVVLVLALILCVCKETGVVEKRTPVLREASPTREDKANATASTVLVPTTDDTDVKVTVDMRDGRHSNGSVVTSKQDHQDNGRPKSHDQRALPEIPHAGVGQTDDEDDDEGHYDIIIKDRSNRSKSKPAASINSSVTSTPAAVSVNLYEKVNNADPTYAGVRDDPSDPDYAGIPNINPYAMVEGIGHADYARIDDRRKDPTTKGSVGQRIQALESQSRVSVDTLNDSYTSVPPPPVPDKNFTLSENSSTLTPNAMPSSPQTSNSPSLPPRNSTHSSDGVEDNNNVIITSDVTTSACVMTSSDVTDGIITMAFTDDLDSSTTGKREPPYSSVTARESLANLRERQAVEIQQRRPLPHDATYESVNYDQITSPAAGGVTSMTSDRHSLTSDLYAEIASGSGDNSTRSSMYAKVGDVVANTHAPTPPPVDILKQLSLPKGEDEVPDPGYSIIRRGRPQSAYSSGSQQEINSQPLYAVVDKNRRNRNTVCGSVSPDVNENMAASGGDVSVHQLYAQVNKPKQLHLLTDYSNNIPQEFVGTGARPKVRAKNGVTNNNPGPSHVTNSNLPSLLQSKEPAFVDPAYQTIPSDDTILPDPGYDDILDNKIIDNPAADFDPNYESVGGESVSRVRMTSPGVATEIVATETVASSNPHGMVHISNHHVDSNFWQRQEHVYQEIGAAQREKERLQRSAEQLQRISTNL